jgi:uncharacterized protein
MRFATIWNSLICGYLNCVMDTTEKMIDQTIRWINSVVVGCNFCPFAGHAMQNQRVRFAVTGETAIQPCVDALLAECRHLNENAGTETVLLILSNGYQHFQSYLQLVAQAEEGLILAGYEGIYQLASFHPAYQFEGESLQDPANYTNRSPYPMLHLLREESVEKAIQHYAGDTAGIPAQNIAYARAKGLVYMAALREACLK